MPSSFSFVNDLHFGCNAGVIRAGLPQSFKALHTLLADKDILQGVVECVSHVQLSGDVGRRHYDCEGFLASGLREPRSISCPAISGRVWTQSLWGS